MAAIRSRGPLPVGSMQWIHDENAQVDRHCEQETEDFSFSARNELEWLNEHMADIFAKDHVNVIEIFKTPGKLRGKTPRTARKRDPLQMREPLSDVFSSNVESHAHPVFGLQNRSPGKPAPAFKIAQDIVEAPANRPQKKVNTDSGYHGLSENEVDADRPHSLADTFGMTDFAHKSPSRLQVNTFDQSEDRSTTERSFHSAREEMTRTHILDNVSQANAPAVATEPNKVSISMTQPEPMAVVAEEEGKVPEEESVNGESRSSSQDSSPARLLVRKSSLTFAALPAREPLTTKKSLGSRTSRNSHLDQNNFLGRFTGGKSLGGTKQSGPVEDEREIDIQPQVSLSGKPSFLREESDPEAKLTMLHNKSSTQRLHEKIHLLGKSQTARPTKSIPAVAPAAQPSYTQLPDAETQPQKPQKAVAQQNNEEDDDDWIQPPKPTSHPVSRPQLSKSVSADVMEGVRGKKYISDQEFDTQKENLSASRAESPQRYAGKMDNLRAASDSRAASPGIYSAYDGVKTFNDAEAMESEHGHHFDASTTPFGSPSSKRYVDGPLSASKSKLQSIMKSAKGLFSSSAGVSAQAKIDLLPSTGGDAQESSNWKTLGGNTSMTKAPDLSAPAEDSLARKTRSSTEKEERKRLQGMSTQKIALEERTEPQDLRVQKTSSKDEVEVSAKSRKPAQPPIRPVRSSPRKVQNKETLELPAHAEHSTQSMAPPVSQAHSRPSQIHRSKDPRRPIKPAKDAGPKPKPQPVAIRVGTLSTQRIPLNNAALSSSLQESLPAPQPKQSVVAKKPSLQPSTSNSSLKGSVNGAAKPKALIVAERKKEQDEKEAQRKREQKAEIDRRRAAQQEDSKRQEVEKQRERERSAAIEDPKKTVQKQAIEKRRVELQKKDQQRNANNHPTTTTRPELGGGRPPSRQQNNPDHHNRFVNNHHPQNPSKAPIKRVFDPDTDDVPARPKPQAGPSYQQNEAKRRRTEDDEEEFPMRPTHVPPVRHSGIKKDGPKPSIFMNSHAQAPPPAPHHHTGPSLLKSTTQNQAHQQHPHPQQISRPGNHPDMKQFANNKIPFADAPNPPAHQQQPQSHKTPYQSKLAQPSATAKASPQYQNGENIHLDDIPTDSEEDDSDPEDGGSSKPKPANLPDWAQSPNLRSLLMHQEEDINPDVIFGPVQSPHMEEMFRERHHRFRSRTSSANWAGQDRLTEEEIRRDVEARQRLRREGVWTFGLAP